mmetsp:Transcript_22707/g.25852  ORF Transcript_22707/g.25852 Transcript_22707/m.25852 type:complete len:83 (+) Transcript_22707:2883-3131(+)
MATVTAVFPFLGVVDDELCGMEKDVPNERNANNAKQESCRLVVEFQFTNPILRCVVEFRLRRRWHDPPKSPIISNLDLLQLL